MASVTGGAKLQAKLKELEAKLGKKKTLRVGFLEGATYPTGQTVAEVAAYNNYGTSKSPPRPFFSGMVTDKSPAWPKKLARIMASNGGDVTKSLSLMGEGIKGQLQQSITNFDNPRESDATIERKGFQDTLIHTGHMQNSADWDIES